MQLLRLYVLTGRSHVVKGTHVKPEHEKHIHEIEVHVPEGYSEKPHGKPIKINKPEFEPKPVKEPKEHKVGGWV
jgi:hypothetical protein